MQWFGHIKEWKRVLGVVNGELSRLVVVFPEGDPGKHGMRSSEEI